MGMKVECCCCDCIGIANSDGELAIPPNGWEVKQCSNHCCAEFYCPDCIERIEYCRCDNRHAPVECFSHWKGEKEAKELRDAWLEGE